MLFKELVVVIVRGVDTAENRMVTGVVLIKLMWKAL